MGIALAPLTCFADTTTPVDPCQLMSSANVAQAMDTTAQTVGKPQHPTPQECVWTVASKTGAPTETVVLDLENADAARKCHGLGCLYQAQSIVGSIPGVPGQFTSAVSTAMNGAQMVNGIGQRAGWKNGALTVIDNSQAFSMRVNSSASDSQRLAVSETLARDVVNRLPDATPSPSQ